MSKKFAAFQVNGVPIKEYLMRSLVYTTATELMKDEEFILDTNIKTSSNLTIICRKLGINMESIYRYGIDNGYILIGVSFLKWLENTNREIIARTYRKKGYTDYTDVYNGNNPDSTVINKTTTSHEVLCMKNIAKNYGLDFGINETPQIIASILLDLYNGDKSALIRAINEEKRKIEKQVKIQNREKEELAKKQINDLYIKQKRKMEVSTNGS